MPHAFPNPNPFLFQNQFLRQGLVTLWGVYAGLFAAPAPDEMAALSGVTLKKETGEVAEISGGEGHTYKVRGTTSGVPGTQYLVFSLNLNEPIDLTGKELNYRVSTTEGTKIIAHYVRAYNQGETKPCLSHLNYNFPFKSGPLDLAIWSGGATKPLEWEKNKVSGGEPRQVNRLQFWFGTQEKNLSYEAVVSKIQIAPQRLPVETDQASLNGGASAAGAPVKPTPTFGTYPWNPLPERATVPAAVSHPSGAFKKEFLDRARENIKRHPWAQDLLAAMKKRASFWMEKSPGEIDNWIPLEDAWFKCLCPVCGTQPEFAWNGEVLEDGKSIQCTKCQTVFPNEKFPENYQYEVKTPQGGVKTISCHLGKDQWAQGENYGPRYHLTGAVNYVKQRKLGATLPMALIYQMTGDKAYAQKVRQILLRFAQAYPLWSVKYRATAYPSPRDHFMAGKMCDWKFHDGGTIPSLLNAYDLTAESGLYSDRDRLEIENGIAREYKWLITAHPVTKDICPNAVPAHMLATALCATTLGDQALLDYTLLGKDGLVGFVESSFTRDGFWYEGSPSYANMAIDPMVPLVMALSGAGGKGRGPGRNADGLLDPFLLVPALSGVFTGMSPAIMPTGRLPAVNDSVFIAAQSLAQVELMAALKPSEEMGRLLTRTYAHAGVNGGNFYSLLLRDPSVNIGQAKPAPGRMEESALLPGAQWMVLRHPGQSQKAATLLSYGGDVGGHTHNCTLGLVYFDHGAEVSSDLGYLTWWHNHRTWINSTMAHNLVMVDGTPQDKNRIGLPRLFVNQGSLRAGRVEAPSCYPGVTQKYERTLVSLPLPGGQQYLVDFFSTAGGKSHLYIFHADGPAQTPPPGLAFRDFDGASLADKNAGSEWLKNGQRALAKAGPTQTTWQLNGEIQTTLHFPALGDEELFTATGPGLRDPKTPYLDTPLHLFMARRAGPASLFAAAVESYRGAPQVREARRLPTTLPQEKACALSVETAFGSDLILLSEDPQTTLTVKSPAISMTGRMGVVRLNKAGRVTQLWLEGPGSLMAGGKTLMGRPLISGKIISVTGDGHTLNLSMTATPDRVDDLPGRVLFCHQAKEGVYRMAKAIVANNCLVVELDPGEVVNLVPGLEYIIPTWSEGSYE